MFRPIRMDHTNCLQVAIKTLQFQFQYLTDYNNNPPNDISFMPVIASTSGRLHGEFVRLLFLQVHRETGVFFTASGVQIPQHDRGQFHYRRSAFSSQVKSKCGNILDKATSTTNYFEYRRHTCGVKITHSPITLANLSSINLVSIFRCSSPPHNPVYVRRVDPQALALSLSSHRHS